MEPDGSNRLQSPEVRAIQAQTIGGQIPRTTATKLRPGWVLRGGKPANAKKLAVALSSGVVMSVSEKRSATLSKLAIAVLKRCRDVAAHIAPPPR